MASNIGEEIVGTYLKVIKGCEFVDYNIDTIDSQGEIDVIGVDPAGKKVYICEVAIHLETGLQYTDPKTKRPDNTERLVSKFGKGVTYARNRFENYEKIFMFWSPIVKDQKSTTKHNQLESVREAQRRLQETFGINLVLKLNGDFQSCLDEIGSYSGKESKELRTPVLRLMQIEEKLKRHLARNKN